MNKEAMDKMINVDNIIEYCNTEISMLIGHKQSVAVSALRRLIEYVKEEAIEAEPVRHGRWIMREKDELIETGKIAVSEGRILHKTSFDEPFTLQSANIIKIKEHRTVKIPYCSICGNYGDDEYDKTPFCPYCGAKMDGGEE